MNKAEIEAKIAELERQIKERKDTACNLQKKDTADTGTEDGYSLCLGGGGGKGAYQLGVYKALSEYGIMDKVTAISGTSIGAINAVLFACNSPDKSAEAWKKIDFETVFDIDPELIFNDKVGFMSRNEMLKLMHDYLDYDKISNGDITIYATIAECVQDEYTNAEYINLTGCAKEEIDTVILASSTLPVLYESVTYNNKEYCDGGLVDNVPVEPLYNSGSRKIIVCGLNPRSPKNLSAYADAEIIEIYPSVYLGDLIDGTLDFSGDSMKFRSLLGYKDTMRALKVHFEKDPDYIAALDYYRDIDLAEIKTEMTMHTAHTSVQSSMEGIDRILDKLGIHD